MATRGVMRGMFAGGALLALMIGCSTSVEDADGDVELRTSQHAIPIDPCMQNPYAPGCESYDPPGSPTPSGGASMNTSSWTISHAGWNLTATAPAYWGSGSDPNMANSKLHAYLTMTRTTAATASDRRGFGAALVRSINKPGGIQSTPCTRNAECNASGVAGPNADGSFNYCVLSGTNTNKTCVQRPGDVPYWQAVVTGQTSFTLGETKTFEIPNATGAPFGSVTGVIGPNWDSYSVMMVINLVPSVSYTLNGVQTSSPPCQLYNVLSPNNIPYEEDPQFCYKYARPFAIYQKAACGDGVCGGTETQSSCWGDCQPQAPETWCGDGVCNGGETSTSCKCDCNATCLRYPYKCGC